MRVTTTRTAMAAAALMMLAGASGAWAQELLLNGGFEQFNADDPRTIPNWQSFGNALSSGEYARTEAGQSFKAYNPYFHQGAGSVGLQTVTAAPGEAFRLTGFIYSPLNDRIHGGDIGIFQLNFLNAANARIANTGAQATFTSTSPADTWVPYTLNATAPAGAVKAEVVIGFIQINEPAVPPGAIFYDDLSLTRVVANGESTWIATGGGDWLTPSNWSANAVPNAAGAVARFGGSITAPATVAASSNVTVGTLSFDSANAYTLSGGGGSLTVDVATGNGTVGVTQGSHTVNYATTLNDPTVATVAAGSTLTLGGNLTLANGSTLTTAGAGTTRITSPAVIGSAGAGVRVTAGVLQADADLGTGVDVRVDAGEARFGASQNIRSLNLSAAGAKATLSDAAAPRVIKTGVLTIASGSALEIADNGLIVDYTGASPADAIRTALAAGAAGNWAGTSGILSSKAAADPRYSVGYAEASQVGSPTTFMGVGGVDGTSVLVRSTLKGDYDLNGAVNFDDLLSLAQSYDAAATGKVWRQGDGNYDGRVNFDDLLSLAQNYGSSALGEAQTAAIGASLAADFALAQSLVPEPTMLTVLGGGATLLVRRRRPLRAPAMLA